MYKDIKDVASDIDHVCHIDCDLIIREDGGRSHIMYPASPTTAAGRYQYDRNREIYTMGKGARAAMRATGQSDTRNNREWNYARKLLKVDAPLFWQDALKAGNIASPFAYTDARYRERANAAFGPDRRPYVKRSIRARARLARQANGAVEEMLKGDAWRIVRPSYLAGSEHDPNL